MKQISRILAILLFTSINVNSQSLDQILEKHYEAVGMEYLKEVQTIRYEGHYVNHFLKKISDNIPEYLMKPDFILSVANHSGYLLQVIDDERGEGAYGYCDGKYWKDPAGFPPEKWNPGDSDRSLIEYYVDLEGFTYDWKNKGYKAEKLDDCIIDNKDNYRVSLITSKNDSLYFYIDKESNLISKISFNGDISSGKEFPSFTFSKYKKVENINIPFKRIHRTLMLDGTYDIKDIIIEKIEINPKLDRDIFKLNHRIDNQKNESK